MDFATLLFVLAGALLIDAAVGYPQSMYRRIGHPVTWFGALIGWADQTLNRPQWSSAARRVAGVLALILLIGVSTGVAFVVQTLLLNVPGGLVVIAILASTMIASRSLFEHVSAVMDALDTGGLDAGRRAVSRIVGRDPQSLDEHGVARAAIESLAENSSDGVIAPVFWFAVLGLPGLVAYKVVNTADSMIGHLTPKHAAFGWASARLDDLINIPASRLTALFFYLASALIPDLESRGARRAVWRDARKHRSPNAGWPESAMAGALGLKLAGPRIYAGDVVDDAFMGDGRREANADDINRALQLAATAWGLMLCLVTTIAMIAHVVS